MSIRAKLAASAASVGVLALGWQIGTAHGQTLATSAAGTNTLGTASATTQPVSPSTSASSASSSTSSTKSSSPMSSASSSTSSSSSSSASSSASTGKSGTYTGTTSTNRYGSVQVTVTLTNGKITNVTEQVSAYDGHSQMINSRAVPTLHSEVLAANSADISSVSGATYTSESYIESLQSALDQAK